MNFGGKEEVAGFKDISKLQNSQVDQDAIMEDCNDADLITNINKISLNDADVSLNEGSKHINKKQKSGTEVNLAEDLKFNRLPMPNYNNQDAVSSTNDHKVNDVNNHRIMNNQNTQINSGGTNNTLVINKEIHVHLDHSVDTFNSKFFSNKSDLISFYSEGGVLQYANKYGELRRFWLHMMNIMQKPTNVDIARSRTELVWYWCLGACSVSNEDIIKKLRAALKKCFDKEETKKDETSIFGLLFEQVAPLWRNFAEHNETNYTKQLFEAVSAVQFLILKGLARPFDLRCKAIFSILRDPINSNNDPQNQDGWKRIVNLVQGNRVTEYKWPEELERFMDDAVTLQISKTDSFYDKTSFQNGKVYLLTTNNNKEMISLVTYEFTADFIAETGNITLFLKTQERKNSKVCALAFKPGTTVYYRIRKTKDIKNLDRIERFALRLNNHTELEKPIYQQLKKLRDDWSDFQEGSPKFCKILLADTANPTFGLDIFMMDIKRFKEFSTYMMKVKEWIIDNMQLVDENIKKNLIPGLKDESELDMQELSSAQLFREIVKKRIYIFPAPIRSFVLVYKTYYLAWGYRSFSLEPLSLEPFDWLAQFFVSELEVSYSIEPTNCKLSHRDLELLQSILLHEAYQIDNRIQLERYVKDVKVTVDSQLVKSQGGITQAMRCVLQGLKDANLISSENGKTSVNKALNDLNSRNMQ